jgi:hypothetical protein
MNRAEKRRMAKRYDTPKKQEQLAKYMYEQAKTVCEESYKKQTEKNIDTMLLALKYTLHFSDLTKFGNKRLNEFMDDLMATFEGFSTGEYNKDEYRKALLDDGIKR